MWTSHSYTDTGKVRQINEDALLDLSEEHLWLVADGMGGHSYGDYASQLIVSTLRRYTEAVMGGINKIRITSALEQCNRHLVKMAEEECADIIGCTVAILRAQEQHVVCCWSGDSRIYRLRHNELLMLTVDHSQEQAVDDRDRIRYPGSFMDRSGMLTRAIGGDPALELEHCWYGLKQGDRFLLCTDGLCKEVNDNEIGEALINGDSDEAAVTALADLYQTRGARDNVGILVATHRTN